MPDPPVLRLTLRNGHPVALRPIEPADRDRLAAGFDALSPTSRRLRFLGSVSSLSDAHLRYLTEVDGRDHVAWVALDLVDPSAPGFGVGRFVRLGSGESVAEFSLTVLDTVQGHGVGQLLLAVLAVVAPTVDVDTLRGVVGRENERMAAWLLRLGAVVADDGHDLTFDLVLPVDPDASSSAAEFVEVVQQIREALDGLDGASA
ncbi:GNAT family N-acetyltransferase [Rubrivirga sp.]|uniref:GNAT family N-acetyltransferase n=1 Tax=Rubrivirga sp. TaxID=1885344 RepID=UPI003B51A8B6